MRRILYDYPSQEGSRLLYVRYADEFVIMIIGSKSDALNIRIRIKDYLVKCGLTLNIDKTLITNTKKEGFRFLGAHINRAQMVKSQKSSAPLFKTGLPPRRRMTYRMRVYVDLSKIYKKLVENKFARYKKHSQNIPLGTAKNQLINKSPADIVEIYNLKIRGLIKFFSFAGNRHRLWDII